MPDTPVVCHHYPLADGPFEILGKLGHVTKFAHNEARRRDGTSSAGFLFEGRNSTRWVMSAALASAIKTVRVTTSWLTAIDIREHASVTAWPGIKIGLGLHGIVSTSMTL